MMRIGLTGNIGTGKSTVARVFEVMGVKVYHADMQAKKLLYSREVIDQIAHLFGDEVINSEQQVDRTALAEIVFNDKTKLAALNNLIHPLVEADFEHWCALQKSEVYVLQEAAILFESGFDRLFAATILVTAPEELCLVRVMKRDGVTPEKVTDRMNNQWSQEKKMELAQYLIINDEKKLIIPQVLKIHSQILHM
jgi:dephospho-CoA kinase